MPYLSQRTLRRLLTLATLTLLSATLALAQERQPSHSRSARPSASSLVDSLTYSKPKFTNWNSLAEINPSGKVFVVTSADPMHRHTCRVESFTGEQLACKGLGNKIYRMQEIAALIVPGDFAARVGVGIGFTSAAALVIWRTVVLAATCTPCAVGVGIAAFMLVVIDLGMQAADPVEDSLLYLAPGQTLQVKLRI